MFFSREAFSRQRRFIDEHIFRFEDAAIPRDHIPGGETHNVSVDRLFAEAIRRIYEEVSISPLFE